jgi:hypothetical protein
MWIRGRGLPAARQDGNALGRRAAFRAGRTNRRCLFAFAHRRLDVTDQTSPTHVNDDYLHA